MVALESKLRYYNSESAVSLLKPELTLISEVVVLGLHTGDRKIDTIVFVVQ